MRYFLYIYIYIYIYNLSSSVGYLSSPDISFTSFCDSHSPLDDLKVLHSPHFWGLMIRKFIWILTPATVGLARTNTKKERTIEWEERRIKLSRYRMWNHVPEVGQLMPSKEMKNRPWKRKENIKNQEVGLQLSYNGPFGHLLRPAGSIRWTYSFNLPAHTHTHIHTHT